MGNEQVDNKKTTTNNKQHKPKPKQIMWEMDMIEVVNLSFLQVIWCATFQPLTQHVSIARK
jgi:cytoskeletal protein RodZ